MGINPTQNQLRSSVDNPTDISLEGFTVNGLKFFVNQDKENPQKGSLEKVIPLNYSSVGSEKEIGTSSAELENSILESLAVANDRSRSNNKEIPKEKANLENYVLATFSPELMHEVLGVFPYNDAIVCMINPSYANQTFYISADFTYEVDGQIFAKKDTRMSIPKGMLKNLDFDGEITYFEGLPVVLDKDIKLNRI